MTTAFTKAASCRECVGSDLINTAAGSKSHTTVSGPLSFNQSSTPYSITHTHDHDDNERFVEHVCHQNVWDVSGTHTHTHTHTQLSQISEKASNHYRHPVTTVADQYQLTHTAMPSHSRICSTPRRSLILRKVLAPEARNSFPGVLASYCS